MLLINSTIVPIDQIEKLRKVKESRGLSYDELGHQIGVHSMSVYRWLKYGKSPKSRAVRRALDEFLERNAIRGKRPPSKERSQELETIGSGAGQ